MYKTILCSLLLCLCQTQAIKYDYAKETKTLKIHSDGLNTKQELQSLHTNLSNTNIKEIILHKDCLLSYEKIKEITNFLGSIHIISINSLFVIGQQPFIKTLINLINNLKTYGIKTVSLKNCYIYDSDIKMLSPHWPETLENLSLGHNQITDLGLSYIINHWPPQLIQLGLCHNHITDEGARMLKSNLPKNRLDLSNNPITAASLLVLIQPNVCQNFELYTSTLPEAEKILTHKRTSSGDRTLFNSQNITPYDLTALKHAVEGDLGGDLETQLKKEDWVIHDKKILQGILTEKDLVADQGTPKENNTNKHSQKTLNDLLNDLKTMIDKVQIDELAHLSQFKEKTKEIEDIKTCMDLVFQDLGELRNQNQSHQKTIDDHAEIIKQMDSTINTQKTQIDIQQKRVEKFKNEISTLKQITQGMHERLETLEEKSTNIKNDIEEEEEEEDDALTALGLACNPL
jgi:hypothetical protein